MRVLFLGNGLQLEVVPAAHGHHQDVGAHIGIGAPAVEDGDTPVTFQNDAPGDLGTLAGDQEDDLAAAPPVKENIYHPGVDKDGDAGIHDRLDLAEHQS